MALVLIICLLPFENVYAKDVTKNGFTYDDNYYSITWKSAGKLKVYSAQGGLLGTLTYKVGVAKLKGTKDYTLLQKLTMTPNDDAVKDDWGRMMYGLSEYLSTNTIVPGEMGDYSPTNDPSSDEISISLGKTIGASYSINCDDLDISACCSTPKKKFYEIYNYLPSLWRPWASNKYVANESSQYCMCQFETSVKSFGFSVSYDARFGASEDNKSSPWYIIIDYVKKATKSAKFTFTF